MLKNIYGEMIIKKGSILYHKNDKIKPMLFYTFHPSDYMRVNL